MSELLTGSAGERRLFLGNEAIVRGALDRCHARSLVVANTAILAPYPVAIGQAKYPSVEVMFQRLAEQVGALLAFDAGALARKTGSPLAVNMVLLGALATTQYLPLAAADLLSVIRIRTKEQFLASNLQAFELGAAAAREPRNWRRRPKA